MEEGRKKSYIVLKSKHRKRIDETPFELRSKEARRNFLLEKQEGKCLECGIAEWNGKSITLEYDHIDGNNNNQVLSNARMLCPNCHSQTDTFRKSHKKNSSHIPDDIFSLALKECPTIYSALRKLKLPNSSFNYKRAKALVEKFKG